MADEDTNKPISEIELEDGEIEDEEVDMTHIEELNKETTESGDIVKNDDNEQQDNISKSSNERQQSFRKRHIDDEETDSNWKKTRTDDEETVEKKAWGNESGEEMNIDKVDDVPKSPAQKWGYDSDDNKKDSSEKEVTTKSGWGSDNEDNSGGFSNRNDDNRGKSNDSGFGNNDNNGGGWENNRNNDQNDGNGGGGWNNNRNNDAGWSGGRNNDNWNNNRNNDQNNGGGWNNNRGNDGGWSNNRNNDNNWNNNRNNDQNDGNSGGGWNNNRNNNDNWGNNRNNDDNGWGNNKNDDDNRSNDDNWGNNGGGGRRGGFRGNRGRTWRNGGRRNDGGGRGRFNNNRGYNNNNNRNEAGSTSGWGDYYDNKSENKDDNNKESGGGGGFSGWSDNEKEKSPVVKSREASVEKWGGYNSDDDGNKAKKSESAAGGVEKSSWGGCNSDEDGNKTKKIEMTVEKSSWGGYNSDDGNKEKEVVESNRGGFNDEDEGKKVPENVVDDVEVEKCTWGGYNSDDEGNKEIKLNAGEDKSAWGGCNNDDVDKKVKSGTVNKFGDSPCGDKWGGGSDDETGGGVKGGNEGGGFGSWGSPGGNEGGGGMKWGESPKKTWGNEDDENQGNSWGGGNDGGNNNNQGNSWGGNDGGNNNNQGNSWGGNDGGNNNNRGRSWGGGNDDEGGNNNNRGRTWGGNLNSRGLGGGGQKRGVCKYFKMGSCRHGDNCKFIHESPNSNDNNNRDNHNSGVNNNNSMSGNNAGGGGFNSNMNSGNNNQEALVKELCKFYEHHQCHKRASCNFMHEEFPCKLYHAGSKMCPSGDSCKYSHAPLNCLTKELLDKYLNEKVDERTDKGGIDTNSNENSFIKDDCMDESPRGMNPMFNPNMMMPQRFSPGANSPGDMMRMPWNPRGPWNPMMRFPPEMSMDMMHRAPRFMMDRFSNPAQFPPMGPRPNQMFARGMRNMMMPSPNGMPYGMMGAGGPGMPPLQSPLSMDESKDVSNNTPDPYLDNLAHIVSNRDNMKQQDGPHKRLVDILDCNSMQCEDMDDYSAGPKNEPSRHNSQASPIKTKSPEIPPGSYVPNNSLNAAHPSVRLGNSHSMNGENQMMYGSGANFPVSTESAMMDYINMSAFYYNQVPETTTSFERDWKLLPLEFAQKVPYPLMVIDTSDVLNKFSDPRLQGHPSVMNPSSSGTEQVSSDTVTHTISSDHVEIIDMTDTSPTYSNQLCGPESIESPLISPNSTENFFPDPKQALSNARAYLQDPRFKRKKVQQNVLPSQNIGCIETVELD